MRHRLSIFTVSLAALATFAPRVFAHPGHDAHAPQQGLLHWLLSPVHWTAAGLIVFIGFFVFAALRRNDSTAKKTIDATAEA
ncbi:hypothetical protein VN12_01345 [Pirellula sp. SH-Sr6A]|uniref:hypothetical protein n=1 Tax=Pirellula sp. SH-Sr6A TaxID=1632865 RepID=UPI00078C8ABE|nr:hypothetical protein [Pirellula sp. SH-Sr6A]AMV30730.1 hypothetical protein VN12_01345 [Pirellula sp. SH-Sr6A]